MGIKILVRSYKLSELWILKWSLLTTLLCPKKIWNLFLTKVSKVFKLSKSLALPVDLLVEPSGDCNYRCLKCDRQIEGYKDDGDNNGKKNLPFPHFKLLMDEIGDTLLTLRLWHYGEPLLNENLFKMIQYAKKKKIVVAVSTNLAMLTPEKAEELVRLQMDYLLISFDGATDETYKKCHQSDKFQKVVENIKMIVETKKKKGSLLPFIDLQFIVMKTNEHETSMVKTLAKNLGVNKLTYKKVGIIEKDKREIDLLPENRKYRVNLNQRIHSCSLPWQESVVRYSGLVVPCAIDFEQSREMGRIFSSDHYHGFKEIWNSTAYQDFRRDVNRDINGISPCKICVKADNSSLDLDIT